MAVSSWKLIVNKADFDMSNIWCAQITESEDYFIITPMPWSSTINAGSSVSFGFQGVGKPLTDFVYTLK